MVKFRVRDTFQAGMGYVSYPLPITARLHLTHPYTVCILQLAAF